MSNGQPCTEGSVSGLSNGLLEKPWLAPWAAKVTVQAVAEQWLPGVAYDRLHIESVLKTAKGQHRVYKDTAGDIGTRIHKIVGAYVEGQLLPEHVQAEDEKRGLENFIRVTKDWEWLGSEITVVKEWCECPGDTKCAAFSTCPNLRGYGGTADGLARIKTSGMIVLPDFKTSNQIAATYDVQCMMYAEATPVWDSAHLAEIWKEIKETRILHFDKELLTWEVLERSIDAHRPYLQHFIGVARWKRKFEQKSQSTYSSEKDFVVQPAPAKPADPASSVFIG